MSDAQIVPRNMQIVTAEDFMPVLSVAQAIDRKKMINDFVSSVLVENEDYGKIPGGPQKPVLLKPGAEKLCSIFGLAPRYVVESETEDWTGANHAGEPFFNYRYRCQLYRGERFMGEAIGSANSWESKHRYRWVPEASLLPPDLPKERLLSRGGMRTLFEFDFALQKEETGGQYGKPLEHWQMFKTAIAEKRARRATKTTKRGDSQGWELDVDMTLFRIPNPDVADIVNTCQKMAQKRGLVSAVLVVTNCSDAFTPDLEDFSTEGIDTGGHPVGTQAAADHVAEQKIAKAKPEIPKPLKALLDNLSKPGYVFQGLKIMRDQLVEFLPANGADEYTRVVEKHGLAKDGQKLEFTVAQAKAAITEMYEVCEFARKQKEQTDASGKFHATDEDLPEFSKPEEVSK